MFTGIVQTRGTVASVEDRGGDGRFAIAAPDLGEFAIGDSIAVSGACLTTGRAHRRGFVADVSRETLDRTTLGTLAEGAAVNLELSLTPSTALGGHLVAGHVDGSASSSPRRRTPAPGGSASGLRPGSNATSRPRGRCAWTG